MSIKNNENEKHLSAEDKQFSIVPKVIDGVGRITLSGLITDQTNSGAQITAALESLMQDKSCTSIEITLMNLYGGSINEGIPSMNAIFNLLKPLTLIVEGLVASMGVSFIAAARGENKKVVGGKNCRILVHKATSSASGSAEELRSAADLTEGYENDMAQALSDKTGMSIDEVKDKWMKSGVDTILTAQQAKDCGLIDEIVMGLIKKDLPKNVIANSDIKAICNFYDKQIELINPKNIHMEKLPQAIAAFKMPVGSTVDAVIEMAIEVAKANEILTTENGQLKTQVTDAKKLEVKMVLDGALEAGKINKAELTHFETLANADLNAVKAILATKKAYVPGVHKVINSSELDEKFKGYTFKDYQKKAPKALAEMKVNDPEKFEALKSEYLQSREGN